MNETTATTVAVPTTEKKARKPLTPEQKAERAAKERLRRAKKRAATVTPDCQVSKTPESFIPELPADKDFDEVAAEPTINPVTPTNGIEVTSVEVMPTVEHRTTTEAIGPAAEVKAVSEAASTVLNSVKLPKTTKEFFSMVSDILTQPGDEQRHPFDAPSAASSPPSSPTPSPTSSDRVQVTSLKEGAHFSLDALRGVYLGPVGGDAKVRVGDKTIIWSSATMVRPEAEGPATTVVAPAINGQPAKVVKFGKPGAFGTSICRVVMRMGCLGMNFDQARRVVNHFGCTLADGTVRANLKSADTGKLGKPADLTTDQLAELRRIAS